MRYFKWQQIVNDTLFVVTLPIIVVLDIVHRMNDYLTRDGIAWMKK